MSELSELRELKIGMEAAEQFFTDLEGLIAEHLEAGTPIELVAFYTNLAHMGLMGEVAAELYEE